MNNQQIVSKKLVVKMDPKTNTFINPFKSNPTMGYITVSSEEVIAGSWARVIKKTHNIKGEVLVLDTLIETQSFKENISRLVPEKKIDEEGNETITYKKVYETVTCLEGRLVVIDCLENEIPPICAAELNKKLSREEAISYYIKRAGKDGPVLMKDGQRILRFTLVATSPDQQDIIIKHDNTEEVKLSKTTTDTKAKLPK